MRKTATLELVRVSTGRDPEELLRDLYIERRHSDNEIASALTAATGFPIGRAAIQLWRKRWDITRDDRPAVAL